MGLFGLFRDFVDLCHLLLRMPGVTKVYMVILGGETYVNILWMICSCIRNIGDYSLRKYTPICTYATNLIYGMLTLFVV